MRRRLKRDVMAVAVTGLAGSALTGGLAAAGGSPAAAATATRAATATATAGPPPVSATLTAARLAASSSPSPAGLAEPDGSLYTLSGSFPAIPGLAQPVVGWSERPGGGAWEVSADGGVFTRGGAPFLGSTASVRLAQPIVGMAATPSGRGYWLVARDGGVFSFGDARFHGSTGSVRLAQPIVGMAATPSGRGYWLVARDGGVFTFGDATFSGSTGAIRLAQPVIGMAAAPGGHGYWLAAADGGLFSFGSAGFGGSVVGRDTSGTESVAADGIGYDEVQGDGTVWSFRPGQTPVRHQLPVPLPERRAALSPSTVASTALAVARSEIGKPYVYGAAGPNAFDCSGLTQFAYARAGVSLPRTAAEQLAAEPHVSASQLQPGDLVFFYPGITHVGIYIGNGQMVDAPHPGAAVRVDQMEYFGPLMGAARPAA